MNSKLCRTLAFVLSLSVMSGCYGPFNLTRRLHRWNGSVDGKLVNELVFLGMVILPVYEIATLADMLVFNTVEWWTGQNPMSAKSIRSPQDPDRETVLRYRPDNRSVQVYNFDKGRPVSSVVLEPGMGGMVARTRSGELLYSSKTEGSQVVVRDGHGRELGRYDAAELQGRLPADL